MDPWRYSRMSVSGILFDAVPTRIIEAHELADVDPDLESLRNLNTPDDYRRALAALTPPPADGGI